MLTYIRIFNIPILSGWNINHFLFGKLQDFQKYSFCLSVVVGVAAVVFGVFVCVLVCFIFFSIDRM